MIRFLRINEFTGKIFLSIQSQCYYIRKVCVKLKATLYHSQKKTQKNINHKVDIYHA